MKPPLSSRRRHVCSAPAYSRRHGGLRTDHRHQHVWQKVKETNLGHAYALLATLYSDTLGSLGCDPVSMFRSCLAMMLFCGTFRGAASDRLATSTSPVTEPSPQFLGQKTRGCPPGPTPEARKRKSAVAVYGLCPTPTPCGAGTATENAGFAVTASTTSKPTACALAVYYPSSHWPIAAVTTASPLAILYHACETFGRPIQTASLDAAHDALGSFA